MSRKSRESGGLVFSTEFGKMCPGCGESVSRCRCNEKSGIEAGDGVVRVSRETKGRKGKGVTLITGVPLEAKELKDLAKNLKQKCGVGGAIKDRVIEIQGDHRERLVEELKKYGWVVKKAGG
ncbi:translation initiation factor Sui1 [Alkalimarinus alittae]|uniref:Translation initiation factor Sui1 n=1 Tax=Alkalimarinus alittae TaxID=2961619 RepID=A0ABY6MYC5_9ALTE|nr:translation initiation factor Sui1 [Alkalimarinus alittae]UZE94829.1 translation initiation factor Sui1 [Alkalimarinus alittae]